jgi:hypothetical protein
MRTVHSNRNQPPVPFFQGTTANFVPYWRLLSCSADHVSGHPATMLMAWKLPAHIADGPMTKGYRIDPHRLSIS